MKKMYYVYIMASKRNGTLYIGVTSNLIKRVYEHKNDMVKGFTKQYGVHRPVIPAKAGIQMKKMYYVYIMASKRNGTLYIGVTSNLAFTNWSIMNRLRM